MTDAAGPIGLKGQRVRLVPIDRERHLENYVRWMNDPDVTRWLLRFLPMTRQEEEEWFTNVVRSRDDVVWAIHDEHDRHIGGTGVHGIDWLSRSATTGIFIGDKSAWGQGYGSEVMQVRTAWAFEELGLHRLKSECFVENEASARALAKAGYRRIGVARQSRWRHGQWHDTILWDNLAADYFDARTAGP